MWQISNVNMSEQKFHLWRLLFHKWVFSNYAERKVFDVLELDLSYKAQQPPHRSDGSVFEMAPKAEEFRGSSQMRIV